MAASRPEAIRARRYDQANLIANLEPVSCHPVKNSRQPIKFHSERKVAPNPQDLVAILGSYLNNRNLSGM